MRRIRDVSQDEDAMPEEEAVGELDSSENGDEGEETDEQELSELSELSEGVSGKSAAASDEGEQTGVASEAPASTEREAEEEEEAAEEESESEGEESLEALLTRDQVLDAEAEREPRGGESRETLSVSAAPISSEEFTCRSCFLVKRQAQLADEERLVCFDCV
jgi:hypothetical protein